MITFDWCPEYQVCRKRACNILFIALRTYNKSILFAFVRIIYNNYLMYKSLVKMAIQ